MQRGWTLQLTRGLAAAFVAAALSGCVEEYGSVMALAPRHGGAEVSPQEARAAPELGPEVSPQQLEGDEAAAATVGGLGAWPGGAGGATADHPWGGALASGRLPLALPGGYPTPTAGWPPRLGAAPEVPPYLAPLGPIHASPSWTPPVPPTAAALPTATPVPPATATPIPTQAPLPTPDPFVAAGAPVLLEMPSIGVAAPIEQVGLTPDRAMGVPKKWMDAGWYEDGFYPGESGNAVIAGHLDSNTGGPAVFWDLDKLGPGDEVIVTYENGDRYTFVVQTQETYPYDTEGPVIESIFGGSLTADLNLITCDGAWSNGKATYSHRLVVFTTLVPEKTERAVRPQIVE